MKREKETDKRRSLRFDLILIAILLAVSLVAVGVSLLTQRAGSYAIVKVDGVTVLECPLGKDGEYILGDGSNTLVVEGGEVYMKEADCPTKSCVNVGKIKYSGQSIVCLPNKITVLIVGDSEGSVDFVSEVYGGTYFEQN